LFEVKFIVLTAVLNVTQSSFFMC